MSSKKVQVEIRLRIRISGTAKLEFIELIISRLNERQDISTFESNLSVDGISKTAIWSTNDIQLLEAYFIQYLQRLISDYDPYAEKIEVLEDTHSLLTLRSAYCQHCGKKLYETYGHAFGVVKKCSNCGRFSFYRDHK